jgi:hypothetical protein
MDGMMFNDPVMEMPMQYTAELWKMINLTMVTPPMHPHLVKVQVLDRRPFSMRDYRRNGQINGARAGMNAAPGVFMKYALLLVVGVLVALAAAILS